MMKCIFCENELDATTKPEHILHNAFGGRKTTTAVICSRCNNSFGSGIDRALTEQFKEVRNLLQLESGSGDTAPMLRRIHAGTQTINIRGDGSMELVAKPFVANKRADGSYEVQITARSLEDIN